MTNVVVRVTGISVHFFLLALVVLVQCVMRDGEIKPRSNPLDPLGDPTQQHPVYADIISFSPGWCNFSFVDSTGSVQCSLIRDFERYRLYYEVSKDSPGFRSGTLSKFEIDGLKANKIYTFRFKGYYKRGDSISATFTHLTPSGKPPCPPSTFYGTGTTNGVSLTWSMVNPGTSYVIERIDSSGKSIIKSPLVRSEYNDTLTDYKWYNYRVGSTNQYGTAFLNVKKTLKKVAGILPPKECGASKGLYPDFIKISWSKVSKASAYRVYRSFTEKGVFIDVKVTTDSTCNDSIDSTGSVYYCVAAVNDSGNTGVTGAIVSGSITDSIDVPSGVVATKDGQSNCITVIWNKVQNARLYKIYRSTDSNGVYQFLKLISGSYNYFTDSTINRIVNYYKISAVDTNSIETRMSTFAQGSVPDIPGPANVYATQGSHTTVITVSWSIVAGSQMYFVYRSPTAGGPFNCICSTTTAIYSDTVVFNSSMYYAVSCRMQNIESRQSSPVKGWSLSTNMPANLTASLGTYVSHVALQWQGIGGASGYNVYRASASSSAYLKIGSTSESRFADSTVPTNDYYYYRVEAHYSDGTTGPQSGYTQGFTKMIGRPDGLVAGDLHPEIIYLKWNNVTGADYYIVYRSSLATGVFAPVDTLNDTSFADRTLPESTSTAYYTVAAGIRSRIGLQSLYCYATLLPAYFTNESIW